MDALVEFFKKMGVPIGVLAIVVVLAVAIPMAFQIDDRYAKEKEIDGLYSKLDKITDELITISQTEQHLLDVAQANSTATPIPHHGTSRTQALTDAGNGIALTQQHLADIKSGLARK
jgi:hypothetical protein